MALACARGGEDGADSGSSGILHSDRGSRAEAEGAQGPLHVHALPLWAQLARLHALRFLSETTARQQRLQVLLCEEEGAAIRHTLLCCSAAIDAQTLALQVRTRGPPACALPVRHARLRPPSAQFASATTHPSFVLSPNFGSTFLRIPATAAGHFSDAAPAVARQSVSAPRALYALNQSQQLADPLVLAHVSGTTPYGLGSTWRRDNAVALGLLPVEWSVLGQWVRLAGERSSLPALVAGEAALREEWEADVPEEGGALGDRAADVFKVRTQ